MGNLKFPNLVDTITTPVDEKTPSTPEYETVEVFDGEKWVLVRKTLLESDEDDDNEKEQKKGRLNHTKVT